MTGRSHARGGSRCVRPGTRWPDVMVATIMTRSDFQGGSQIV